MQSFRTMKQKKKKLTITTKDGKPLNVPPEGSLGLLALGHVGLIAWRQSRAAYIAKMKSEQKTLGKNQNEEKKEK